MTDGQTLALEQIKEIVVRDDYAIDLENVNELSPENHNLVIELSIHCGTFEQAQGGIALPERERFNVSVPPDFPFQKPEVAVKHTRFAGAAHVQWSRLLCLYQAPQTEWIVEDGMFGFIDRLDLWLRRATANQLDADGEPLHSPVAYIDGVAKIPVVVRENAPAVGDSAWLGYAQFKEIARRVELVEWGQGLDKRDGQSLAPVLLLPTWMPWEFPSTVCELLLQLVDRGINLRAFVYQLQFAALMNDEGSPLYAVLGTPMRGVHGGELKQHLSVWYIEPDQTRDLSLSLLKDHTKDDLVKGLAEDAYDRVIEWAKGAKVHWCHVMEARPEISTRRDHESPMAWFRGWQVLLLGCGALGSNIAVFLAQCGVKRLVLKDFGSVKPGILVRQIYTDADIGLAKVTALAARLKSLRPDLDLLSKVENLAGMGGREGRLDGGLRSDRRLYGV